MIAVEVTTVMYPNDDELYPLHKTVYFNPNLVCAIKPAINEKADDIMTADGMRYRSVDQHGLAQLIDNSGSFLGRFMLIRSLGE